MKNILYLQIIEFILFTLIVLNYKYHYFRNDFNIVVISSMFVCIFISIEKIIRILRKS